VAIDMAPRTAWALNVPLSLTVASAGGLLALPGWVLGLAWAAGGSWVYLVWDAYLHEGTPRATRARGWEWWIKIVITGFYLWLGGWSLLTGWPIGATWLAWKALLFGGIFIAAIAIDLHFKPVGPQLARLMKEGSSDATEMPLRATMDRTRVFVLIVYLLLLVTAWLGTVKPM